MSAACAGSGAQLRLLARVIAAVAFVVLVAASPASLLAESSREDAFARLIQGRTALLRQRYADADRLLSEAIALPGLSGDARAAALGLRAVARTRKGEMRAAIHDFNAAVSIAPEDAALYNNRGNLLLEIGLFTEASKDFDQAIALAPNYGAAHNNRGNALILLGDYAEAVAEFSRAIALMPMSAVPFNGRGRAQLLIGRPAGAIRDLNRAVAMQSGYAEAYANRAEAFVAIRRYEEAANDFSAAIASGMADASTYRRRAAIHVALNRRAEALADLDEANKRDPSTAGAAAPVLPETLAADPILTGALPVSAEAVSATAPAPCAPGTTSANDEPLAKLAEASPDAAAKLLYVKDAGSAPVGDAHAAASAYRVALTCASKERDDAAGPLAPVASAEQGGEFKLAARVWQIGLANSGAHLATHPDYPGFLLRLEMYGSGEPEILHWQPLSAPLEGIGLLHYYAGAGTQGERLEYVAVIDTGRLRLLAIEPAVWGKERATWSWDDTALTVVDPDGVPSRVSLDGHVSLNGSIAKTIHLNGRPLTVHRARRGPSHGQIARRARSSAPSFAQAKPQQRRTRFDPYDLASFQAQRLPPRFRQRGYGHSGGYTSRPYR